MNNEPTLPTSGKINRRLSRELGEIAILTHLAQTPDGMYAYNLRKKVEERIFSSRHRVVEVLRKIADFLGRIFSLHEDYELDSANFNRLRESLIDEAQDNPLLKYNPHIDTILGFQENSVDESHFIELKKVQNKIKEAMTFFKESSFVWKSVSGIYSSLEYLEKNKLISLKEEIQMGNRPMRKVFGITPQGRLYLRRSLFKLSGSMSFIFPSTGSGLQLRKTFQEENFTPILSAISCILADINLNDTEVITELVNEEGSSLRQLGMFLSPPLMPILRSNPKMVKMFIMQAKNPIERQLIKICLKIQLEELQEAINMALSFI